MKFRMTCGVDSATYIEGTFQVTVDDLTYEFTPDETARLVRISITSPVRDIEKFRSEITHTPDQPVKANIVHRFDEALYDRILTEFQRLESHISFSFRLDSIDWQHPKTETICESEGERAIAKIFAFEVKHAPRENPVRVPAAEMAKLIVGSRKYDRLTVPMAFYREGLTEYRARRFITSFFNFYFIIEGLFGGRKTKNWQIEQQFKSHAVLRWAIDGTIEGLRKKNPPVYHKFNEELVNAGRSLTFDGVVDHFVSTRGRLHHFTHNPTRLEGTPLTNPAFEPITEFARGVATFVILGLIVEINKGK